MHHIVRTSLVLLASTFAACTDADPAEDFVGAWAYTEGTFRVDCGGNIMEFPASSSLVETIALGGEGVLEKSDNQGCAGLTFDVAGTVASISPAPQSCTIPGMGTSTATRYTLELDGDLLVSAIEGTFQPEGTTFTCSLTGGGTLARQ